VRGVAAALVLLVAAGETPALADAATGRDVTHGNYMGSGHTCYGMLTITARRITWMTPASLCRSSSYEIADRRDGPDGIRVTYQLKQPSAKCLFGALALTHKAAENRDSGWGATGYPSLAGAARNEMDGTLACYLYRY
jgi:hypothetical protein